jgi:hypothetical protein
MKRHDHTRWLIHFVRDRDPEQDFPGEDEDTAGRFIGGELEMDASGFDVLKTIVRLGGLIPGYSFRGARTTIYGGQPAVCATEMPLYSFAKYATAKADPAKVSAYGIAFLKSEFFAAGGRHAIYGLSTPSPSHITNTSTRRIFTDDVLPQAEQYRYVAYNPSQSHWIDWSHEREWRWVARDDDLDEVWCRSYDDTLGPVPALPLFKGTIDGRPFTRLCLIVWTAEEAEELKEMLTGFYLAGSNNYDTPFDKKLIAASRIIVLKDVVDAVENGSDLDAQTIEGLGQANLLMPIALHSPPANAKATVDAALKVAATAGKAAADAYIAEYPTDEGACGFAQATTYEVTNPIVQCLLANGHASGPYDGKVAISVPGTWPPRQSIDYQEKIMSVVADSLSHSLGITVYMDSRLD